MHLKRVLLYVLPIIFICSAFLFPSINASYIETFIWLIIVATLLLFRDQIKININSGIISLLLFAFAGLVVSSLAYNPFLSFHKALIIIQIVSIFILSGSLTDRNIIKLASKFLIIISALFTIFAFTKYIEFGQIAYNYLSGIFQNGESYSAFAILPFILSIYFIYETKNRSKYLWSICGAIILVGIILSGSYLPLIQVIIFILLGLTSQIKKVGLSPQIFIFAIAIYCLVIYGARVNTLSYSQDYNQNLISKLFTINFENSYQARAYYAKDAIFAFINEPIKGYGLDNFNNAIGFVNNGLNYGKSTAPYSLLLHILVEGGLFYFLIFVIAVYFIIRELKYYINNESDIFIKLLILVLFSQMFHAVYGSGLGNITALYIYFILAGLVYGLCGQGKYCIENKGVIKKIVFQCIIALTILITILSANISRGLYYRDKGEAYIGNENSFAMLYLTKSLSYNSFDDTTWYMLWKSYYLSNKFEQAQFAIKKALEKSSNNSFYFEILANNQKALDQKEDYREYLIKSIKTNQMSDIQRYLDLVEYDYEQNKYAEAISYGEKIIKIYEDFIKAKEGNYRIISKSDIAIINQIKGLLGQMK